MTGSTIQTKSITIIRWTFLVTFIGVLVYSICLARSVSESESIGVLFVFIVYLGAALFIESVVFIFLFLKDLKQNWLLLLLVFIPSSFIPIYFITQQMDSDTEQAIQYTQTTGGDNGNVLQTIGIDSAKLKKYLDRK